MDPSVDPEGQRLTTILVDLRTKVALLEGENGPLAMIRLAPEGIIFHAVGPIIAGDERPVAEEVPAGPEQADALAPEVTETERPRPVTLKGKLKSKPKEGRQDRTGKPTAWARFAAHEEDRDDAHLYSTTFHRHTADIALKLDKDAPLTVQGYPHEQDDPKSKRLDTLSVINLLDYPGMGKKA